jgi:hypothetical protein
MLPALQSDEAFALRELRGTAENSQCDARQILHEASVLNGAKSHSVLYCAPLSRCGFRTQEGISHIMGGPPQELCNCVNYEEAGSASANSNNRSCWPLSA